MHLHGHGTALTTPAQLQVLAVSCCCTRLQLGKWAEACPGANQMHPLAPPEGLGALRQGHQVGRVLIVVVVRLLLLIPGVRGPGGAAGPAGVYARVACIGVTSCRACSMPLHAGRERAATSGFCTPPPALPVLTMRRTQGAAPACCG